MKMLIVILLATITGVAWGTEFIVGNLYIALPKLTHCTSKHDAKVYVSDDSKGSCDKLEKAYQVFIIDVYEHKYACNEYKLVSALIDLPGGRHIKWLIVPLENKTKCTFM